MKNFKKFVAFVLVTMFAFIAFPTSVLANDSFNDVASYEFAYTYENSQFDDSFVYDYYVGDYDEYIEGSIDFEQYFWFEVLDSVYASFSQIEIEAKTTAPLKEEVVFA